RKSTVLPKPCAKTPMAASRCRSAFRRTLRGAAPSRRSPPEGGPTTGGRRRGVAWAVLTALALACAGCVTAPPASEPDRAPGEAEQAAFAAAVDALRAREFAAAAARLEALTRDFPRLATPWANLGIAYAGLGREAEAEQAW